MDWIDITLIVLGVAGCGMLHLTALMFTHRDRLEIAQQQTRGPRQTLDRR